VSDIIIDIQDLGYCIGGVSILADINWQIRRGERWAVLGANGAGKTTLLRAMCGYIWPNAGGKILRGGERLVNLRELRKSVGWVTSALAEKVPYHEEVLAAVVSGKFAQFGLCEYSGQKIAEGDFEAARRCLVEVGAERLEGHLFGTLSQGEKQRVLIARARMAKPMILILDEPCAGLDPGGREVVLSSIEKLCRENEQAAIVYVTHHIEEILGVFGNTLAMAEGKLIAKGLTRKIVNAELMGKLYGIEAKVTYESGRYNLVPLPFK